MPSNNEKPRVADLGALLKGLNEAGVEFILVGGVSCCSARRTQSQLLTWISFMSLNLKLSLH